MALSSKKSIITICASVVIIAAVLYACLHSSKPLVKTATVSKHTIKQTVTAVGNIVPKHIVTIKSPLAGTVGKLFHDSGDYIKNNEPLLRVKPNPTPQQLAEALELVAKDKAALNSDQQQLTNYQQLQSYHIISNQYEQFVRAKQSVLQDKSTLAFDQQKLDLLQKGQTKINGQVVTNTITSPLTGYVLSRNVDIGDSVVSLNDMQTATPLFIVANMKDLQFKGTVDETDANQLKIGMPADIQIAATPGKTITGQIALLALQSDQQTQIDNPSITTTTSSNSTTNPFNVGFEIRIDQLRIPEDLKLRSGFSATANIVIKQAKQVNSIPEIAVHDDHGKHFVWLNHGNKPASKQYINTGLSDGMQVEVLSGLTLGQQVNLDEDTQHVPAH